VSHREGAASSERPTDGHSVGLSLWSSNRVLNVGPGAGSYDPGDRYVLAVEPSAVMRAQRPAGAAPAVDAAAERLPFDDDSCDAAMATMTVHHRSILSMRQQFQTRANRAHRLQDSV
jgi:hypothetical protein